MVIVRRRRILVEAGVGGECILQVRRTCHRLPWLRTSLRLILRKAFEVSQQLAAHCWGRSQSHLKVTIVLPVGIIDRRERAAG